MHGMIVFYRYINLKVITLQYKYVCANVLLINPRAKMFTAIGKTITQYGSTVYIGIAMVYPH